MDGIKSRRKNMVENAARISIEPEDLKGENGYSHSDSVSSQEVVESINNENVPASSSEIQAVDTILLDDSSNVELTELVPVNLKSLPGTLNSFSSTSNVISDDWSPALFDECATYKSPNKLCSLGQDNSANFRNNEFGLISYNFEHPNYSFCNKENYFQNENIDTELKTCQVETVIPLSESNHRNDLQSTALEARPNDTDNVPFLRITCNEGECSRSVSNRGGSSGTQRDVNEDISLQNLSEGDEESTIPQPDDNQVLIGRPKRGRKRKHANQNRDERKKLCIQNKDYFTQRNVWKKAKEFRHFLCQCKCLEKVEVENAKKEFDKFYSVESHDAQRALICSMVSECEIKRKRVKTSNKRQSSRLYKLSGVVVSKTFFLQTLRISSCKLNTALKSMKRPEGVRDCRGISGGKNKIEDSRVQEVIDHIKKFPKYKSHYRRADTDTEFLTEDTTVDKMHQLYSEEVAAPVSLSFYKKIFLSKFNLRRKKLKKRHM